MTSGRAGAERSRPQWPMASSRWLVWLGLVLVLAGCAHGPKTREKGFEVSRSTISQLEASQASRRWAVTIGVDSFDDPSFDPLKHAASDAQEVAWALKHERYGRFDRVIPLTTPAQTTRSGILNEISRLRNEIRRQDTLVIYYSGHGTVEFTPQGVPRLYLVAKDSRMADLYGTAIELDALRVFLRSLRAQRKVLILDSCFAGSGKSRVTAAARQHLESTAGVWDSLAMSMGQSEAILMASTLGGVALEDDKLRHATYTYYLLKALTEEKEVADANRDGAVTAYEAHDYARAAVLERTLNRQIPEGYFRLIGRAEMFLSGTPRPEITRAAALVYAYGETRNGATIEIDGRSKGAFPRTIAVEPGLHRVTIRTEQGRTLADNRLNFAGGQVWALNTLVSELQGYRRYFGVSGGGFYQADGTASSLWGAGAGHLEVTSGYRMRGGALRGLCVGFHLDWNPAPFPASGAESLEPSRRDIWGLGSSVALRRPVGPLQVGLGGHASALYVPAARTESEPTSYAQAKPLQPWLVLPVGPLIWLGYPLNPNVLLTAEARGSFFLGDYTGEQGQTLNSVGSLALGVELGF